MEIMKLIVSILLLLLLAGIGSANSLFKVVDISPIHIYPGSEENFTVTIRSVGGDGAFAQPIFNTSRGLSASAPGGLRYIVATNGRKYNCTMKAENIKPGNYSFQVGVYAQSAPYNWRTAYLTVEAPMNSMEPPAKGSQYVNKSRYGNETTIPKTAEANTESGKSSPMGVPSPGFVLTLAALILAARGARD